MKKCFVVWLTLCSTLLADSVSQRLELEKCLLDCYEADRETIDLILDKVAPLFMEKQSESFIRSFIAESEKLKTEWLLNAGEGLAGCAPYHSVLFENKNVRISWAVTKSGEQEPPQRHPWKTLMLIVQASRFYSEEEGGISYEDDWPTGVYVLEPSRALFACKNIGFQDYKGLIVELKR